MSRLAVGFTQCPVQLVPGVLCPGLKELRQEADCLPLSSAEVKNAWSYISTPPYIFMALCLSKHRVHLHFDALKGVIHVCTTVPLISLTLL